jgi:hypothetical protein
MGRSSTSFRPGVSGNPGGRKTGQTPRGKFRKQVEKAVPQIVDHLVKAALAGDVQAARIILDRVLPALKAKDEAIILELPKSAGLVQQGEALVSAMTVGQVTPVEAQAVMTVLSGQRALIEQGEIARRLEVIEQWLSRHTER